MFSFYLSPFFFPVDISVLCDSFIFKNYQTNKSLCHVTLQTNKQTKKYWNKLLTLSRQLAGTPDDLSRFFKFGMIRLNLIAVVWSGEYICLYLFAI